MGWYVMLLFCLPRESESAMTNLIGTCYWNLYRTNKIKESKRNCFTIFKSIANNRLTRFFSWNGMTRMPSNLMYAMRKGLRNPSKEFQDFLTLSTNR